MCYTTYLFDFDYTLVDSSRGIVACFRKVLENHGYNDVTDSQIKRTIGKTLEESFSILTGVEDMECLLSYKHEYRKAANSLLTVNTHSFPETKSVLAALKEKGARIGIISTKYRFRIEEFLELHSLRNFIDIIIGGEDVQTAKPSPEGLLLAIERLGASKADTLYVGDSTVDAATAQAAEVDFAGVTHGVTTAEELAAYPHKQIMGSLEELMEEVPCTCLNCGTTFTGNYCHHCGQSRKTVRYSFGSIVSNLSNSFFNIDNKFWNTLFGLLYRPGHLIGDFIAGKRAGYFGPFQTLFVLAALYIMAVQLIDPDALREGDESLQEWAEKLASQPDEEITDEDLYKLKTVLKKPYSIEMRIDKFLNDNPFLQKVWNLMKSWAHGNKALRITAMLPLFTICTLLVFRRRQKSNPTLAPPAFYNFTEHLFVQGYIASQLLLLSIIVLPFYGHAQVDNLYEIPDWLIFIIFIWVYHQLFGYSWKGSFWRTLLMFFYCLLIIVVFALLVSSIAFIYLMR